MVKVRVQKETKKQTELEVKLENQQEDQDKDLLDQFDHDNDHSYEEKEFDENKIIKQFLMKRKLLMKALKQKQKEKNPKLLTFQSFQNNEGSLKTQQHIFESNQSPNQCDTPSKQTSSFNSLIQEIQENKIEVQQPADQSDSKLNVGVQAKIIRKKNYTKKSHSKKNVQEKYTVDYLIKDYDNKDKNKQNSVKIKRKRNPKDIESIKHQINSMFNKDNEQQMSSNSKKTHLPSEELSDSQTQRSYYNDMLSIMKGLNQEIQNYYNTKPLKKIILHQLETKIHRRIKEREKKIQNKKKSFSNLKSKRIKKRDKYESFFIETEELEKKIQKKKRQDQKIKPKKKNKKSTAKIINERFQIILTSKDELKREKHTLSTKLSQNKNLSNNSDQNNIYEVIEDFEATEISFDPMAAWKTQFENIQLMLLEKYDYLGMYMTQDKKVDFKHIQKSIKAGAKENSDTSSCKNKTGLSSIGSQSDNSSLIGVKNQPKHRNQKVPIKTSSKKFKPINKRPLKQLQLREQSQDEFGKSFDLHHQCPSQTKHEQNLFIEDLNKSSVISHAFNLSFYSQSTVKKRDTNLEMEIKNINHSILSHAENLSNDSNHEQHQQIRQFSKVRVKENEGLLFKGQKRNQYLHMSEEIQ